MVGDNYLLVWLSKWIKQAFDQLLVDFVSAAMDMKAVKEETAEEEDDDVPGRDAEDCGWIRTRCFF